MMAKDAMDLSLVARQARWNSERWFPEMHTDPMIPLHVFYAIGMASESGEALDVVKKGCRGGAHTLDLEKLKAEMADAFTYMLLLADELHIDLLEAFEAKQAVCEGRWGHDAA